MGTTAFIAMGSNQRHVRYGMPRDVLAAAVQHLSDHPAIMELTCSDVFCSKPIGPPQPNYANAVCAIVTRLDVEELLLLLQGIERTFGRRRNRRWGARVLDLDLIGYGTAQIKRQKLIVPHPRAHLRAFVLIPLAQVAPYWRHPVLGRTAQQLAVKLGGKHTLRRLGPLLLYIPPRAR
jgi:2-amino-4-hydroxy-6-hydroxymethyldihydropteridine diphosphokinase